MIYSIKQIQALWMVFLFLIGLHGVCLQARVVIEEGFEGEFHSVQVPEGNPSLIQGSQSELFEENSSGWADVSMQLSRETVNPYEGKSSFRVQVESIRKGSAQFTVSPVFERTDYIKVSFAIRSTTGSPLEILLRENSTPWTIYWAKSFIPMPQWTVKEFILPPANYKKSASFKFQFSVGEIEIDSLKIELISEEEITKSIVPKKGNLFKTSVFPEGLNGRWSILTQDIESKAIADRENIGPSGSPSLKLVPGYSNSTIPLKPNVNLVSEAIEVNPLRDYTFSAFVKASEENQKVSVAFKYESKTDSETITLKEGWQKIHLTKKTRLSAGGFVNIRIGSQLTFWLDSLQLEEGAIHSEYSQTARVEVAVKPNSEYGLFLEGEIPTLQVYISGEVPEGAVLKGTAYNYLNEDIEIKPIVLKEGSQRLELKDLSKRFGTYSIELRAWKDGEAISTWAETQVHRIRKARKMNADAPDSPFGVHIQATEAQAKMAKALGFNKVRIHDAAAELTKWYFLEKSPNQFDFENARKRVNIFRKHKLQILGMLDTAPAFYNEYVEGSKRNPWFIKYNLPRREHEDKWMRYVKRITSEFKEEITAWEVWNEPYTGNRFFGGEYVERDGEKDYLHASPEDYVWLLKTAYQAAKEIAPELIIIAMNDHKPLGNWQKRLNEAEYWNYADQVSFHKYISVSKHSFPDFNYTVRPMKSVLPESKKKTKFINSEGGSGGANFPNFFRRSIPKDTSRITLMKANHLVRFQIASISDGIEEFYLYGLHRNEWEKRYSLLFPDGKLGPLASTLSNMMWHIEGKKYTDTIRLESNYDTVLFDGLGEGLVILLSTPEVPQDKTVIRQLHESITACDIYGNALNLPITLSDSPVYLRSIRITSHEIAGSLSLK